MTWFREVRKKKDYQTLFPLEPPIRAVGSPVQTAVLIAETLHEGDMDMQVWIWETDTGLTEIGQSHVPRRKRHLFPFPMNT